MDGRDQYLRRLADRLFMEFAIRSDQFCPLKVLNDDKEQYSNVRSVFIKAPPRIFLRVFFCARSCVHCCFFESVL